MSILPVSTPKDLRRHVRGLATSERRAVVLVVVLQAVTTVAGLVGPRILGDIVDDAQAHRPIGVVDLAAAAFLGALVAQTLLTALTRRRSAVLGERVLARLREDFIDAVLALPLGVVERAGSGDLLTRSSTDVDQLSTTIRRAAPEIGIAVVQTVLTVAALVWTAPALGLALVPAVPLLVLGSRWYLRRAPAAYQRLEAAYAKVNGDIQETVALGRTVEAFGLGGRRTARTEDDIRAWIADEWATLRLRTVFFPVTEAAYVVPLVLCVLLGGLLHDAGHLTIGAVTAAALYAQLLIDPVDSVISWLDELQLGTTSLRRLLGVRDVHQDDPTDEEPADRALEVDGVHFAYRAGHDVLVGVDLSVRPGERLAVVGPSGAGKSTLALLAAGVHPPRLGTVEIGGVAPYRLPAARLRREIALVTQEQHVFAGTLRDNLSLVADGADDAVLLDALDAVDARGWAEALPSGLDTVLGWGGVDLSPGQVQQLALARLVLADPHTLVLDEATSLLDPRAARHLERSLARLIEGRSVVMVAHRLQSAHDADRVAVVEGGRVVEEGTHDELLRQGGTYAALWRSWRTEGVA